MPLRMVPSSKKREHDAGIAAASTVDVHAAENDRGDDEKDCAISVVAAGRAVLTYPHQRRDAGERPGQSIGLHL